MTCNHNWSEETHEGVPSRFCHVCNEWEIEVEYDRALAEIDRLNALLASVTAENQDRARREARSLEDWRDLRAENDRLKASRLPDVEYARLDTMWQELVRERDAAVAKATTYERDWYDAKSEFGTATAKLRERVRVVERERDEARAQVERLRGERDEAREHTSTAAFMRIERDRDEVRATLERCVSVQRATAEGWRLEVDELASERDEARAEVAHLRAALERERDVQARWKAYVSRFEAGLADDDARQVAFADEWSSTETDGLDHALDDRPDLSDKCSPTREATVKISDEELRFLSTSDWARTNAAPLAAELIELRAEVQRLSAMLDEARMAHSELQGALASALSSRSGR